MNPTQGSPRSTWRQALDVLVSISVLVACLSVTWSVLFRREVGAAPVSTLRNQPPRTAPLPTQPVPIAGAELRGDPSAKIAILAYSDFQCPYCASFSTDTFPQLDSMYIQTGKVLFAFRHFPLSGLHPFAAKAAEGASCAGAQARFWPMHDLLFQNYRTLELGAVRKFAASLKLETTTFETCLKGVMTERVRADVQSARALGVTGTPTFFLGRIEPDKRLVVQGRLGGAASFERFRAELEKLGVR